MADSEKAEAHEDVARLLVRALAILDTDGENIAGAHVAMAIATLEQAKNGRRPPLLERLRGQIVYRRAMRPPSAG